MFSWGERADEPAQFVTRVSGRAPENFGVVLSKPQDRAKERSEKLAPVLSLQVSSKPRGNPAVGDPESYKTLIKKVALSSRG
jgi:hypothetical protein